MDPNETGGIIRGKQKSSIYPNKMGAL